MSLEMSYFSGNRLTTNRSFCKCVLENLANPSKAENDMLRCNCGEDHPIFEWEWCVKNFAVLKKGNLEVVFHPTFSSGTGAVQGNVALRPNRHYFWEVKIIGPVFGTAMMIGVGNGDVAFNLAKYTYCSLLGEDANSWGLSHNGAIQHNGRKTNYSPGFSQGSLIGVHLDFCQGTLEYFLNRKPLGIAFRDIKSNALYPMISSTATNSSMKLVSCFSLEPNLQLSCMLTIMHDAALYNEFWTVPGVSSIMFSKYWWLLSGGKDIYTKKRNRSPSDERKKFKYECLQCQGKHGKSRRLCLICDFIC